MIAEHDEGCIERLHTEATAAPRPDTAAPAAAAVSAEELVALREAGAAWCSELQFARIFAHIDALEAARAVAELRLGVAMAALEHFHNDERLHFEPDGLGQPLIDWDECRRQPCLSAAQALAAHDSPQEPQS